MSKSVISSVARRPGLAINSAVTRQSPSKVVSVSAPRGIRQIFAGDHQKVASACLQGMIEGLAFRHGDNHALIEFRNNL